MKRFHEEQAKIKQDLVRYEHQLMEFGVLMAFIDSLLLIDPTNKVGQGIKQYVNSKMMVYQEKIDACRHVLGNVEDDSG